MPECHSRPCSLAPENVPGRYIGTRQNHAPGRSGTRHNHGPAHAQAGDRHTARKWRRQDGPTFEFLFLCRSAICIHCILESKMGAFGDPFCSTCCPMQLCSPADPLHFSTRAHPLWTPLGMTFYAGGHSRACSLASENKPGRYIGTRQNHAPAHARTTHRHTPRQVMDTWPEGSDAKMDQLWSRLSCVGMP